MVEKGNVACTVKQLGHVHQSKHQMHDDFNGVECRNVVREMVCVPRICHGVQGSWDAVSTKGSEGI